MSKCSESSESSEISLESLFEQKNEKNRSIHSLESLFAEIFRNRKKTHSWSFATSLAPLEIILLLHPWQKDKEIIALLISLATKNRIGVQSLIARQCKLWRFEWSKWGIVGELYLLYLANFQNLVKMKCHFPKLRNVGKIC